MVYALFKGVLGHRSRVIRGGAPAVPLVLAKIRKIPHQHSLKMRTGQEWLVTGRLPLADELRKGLNQSIVICRYKVRD
jgi:hypothetical protein